MKKMLHYLILFFLIQSVFSATKQVIVQYNGKEIAVNVSADEFLIEYYPETDIQSLLDKYNLIIKQEIFNNWIVVDGNPTEELLYDLKQANPTIIKNAEFDFIMTEFSLPNDSLVTKQWYLTEAYIDWAGSQELPLGTHKVIIGILDSGIATDLNEEQRHPDHPTDVVLQFGDDFSREDDKIIRDKDGHGTAVTGIIFAISNNQIGIAGLRNDNIQGIMHQVFAQGSTTYSRFVLAMMDLIERGINVINFSGGGYAYSALAEDAIIHAFKKNVILVASAGNSAYVGVTYPARFSRTGIKSRTGYTNVIAVGATNRGDERASFSSWGPELIVMAPGERMARVDTTAESEIAITSTTPWYSFEFENYSWTKMYFTGCRGTSFAAPIVSALVANLLTYGNFTSKEILDILIETSDKVGNVEYTYDGQGDFNPEYGYGRVNFKKAIMKALDLVTDIKNPITKKMPRNFVLYQNYPNPFNTETSIKYNITQAGIIELRIFNVLGDVVYVDKQNHNEAGTYKINWDGLDNKGSIVSSGLYFYQIRMKSKISSTKRMILLK